MLSELKRQIAAVDEALKKCGSSPETELSLCKNLLRGSQEKKDSDGIKKWNARISATEKKLKEFKKLNRKRQVFRHALDILNNPKDPDYQRIEISLLDVIQAADHAYRTETGEVLHFDILVKEEPIIRHNFSELKQFPLRMWRTGKMSQHMARGF
jgi:hypothetical protein